ncbi:MAG: ROK family protein [Tissierellia bacterium]|nr:ROK family protein [Tissierellia bacterium]
MNILAIDIGGSFIKYGLFEGKKLILQGKEKSNASKGYKELVKAFDKIVDGLRVEYDIEAVAISTAGVVDVESGEIIHAGPTIANYKGFNWKKHVLEKYSLKCQVDNDVNCALLGEYSIGSAQDKDQVLMLAVGTGVGGAFLTGGRIFRGANNCGLEVGYMSFGQDKFEHFASTSGLINYYKSISGKKNCDGLEIFDLAKKNDSKALEAIDVTMDYLCRGIANITYILDPSYIVLGGGIMEQEDFLRPIIEEKLGKYMLPLAYGNLKLLFAKAGNMAASYGALHHYYQMEGM